MLLILLMESHLISINYSNRVFTLGPLRDILFARKCVREDPSVGDSVMKPTTYFYRYRLRLGPVGHIFSPRGCPLREINVSERTQA